MWEDFTSRLNINAEELIRDNKKEVLNMLVANKHEKVCLYSYILGHVYNKETADEDKN